MKRRGAIEQVCGEVLRELRACSGKTQETIALDAGLDRTYISMLERGLRQPTLETLLVLSVALGVTASEIVAKVESRLNGLCPRPECN
jgi:transcriptional regulator with XRE-family HTH domain